MKKVGILSLFLLTLLIISLILVAETKAEEIDEETGLPSTIKNISDVGEKLTDKEARNQYVKQEWTKILEKNSVGRVLLSISNLFKLLSPVFKIIIGVEYSLSWLFFLSLFAWIFVVILIYKPTKNIFQANKWVALAVAITIPTIAAQFGIVQIIVSFFIPLFKNKWIIIITIIAAAILLWIYSLFMKSFGKALEERIKKENEERREQKAKTAEKLHDIETKATGSK